MKFYRNIISIFFLFALCLPIVTEAQTGKGKTTISGTINFNEQYEAILIFPQRNEESEKSITVPIDKAGHFSMNFQLKSPEFAKFTIIPKAKNKQLAIIFPLFISPGTNNKLNLHYNDSTYLSLLGSNVSGGNQAMITYSNFRFRKLKDLFFHPLTPDNFKVSLKQYFDSADAYVNKFKVKDAKTKNYLNAWAMNDYFDGLSRSNLSNAGIKNWNNVFVKSPVEVYNQPEALLFNETYRCVKQYIQMIDTFSSTGKASSEMIEHRLVMFNRLFTNPQLNAIYNSGELEDYIRNVRINEKTNFEKEFDKFKTLASVVKDSSMKERLLAKFSALRFTMANAPMPDVILKDPAGNPVPLKSFVGKYIYIDMWASWCVPCIAEIPNLRKLEKEYEHKNIVFLSISVDEDKGAWKEKMKSLNLTGHQLETGNSGFADLMNIQGIPHFIMYDPSGKLMIYNAPRPGTETIRTIFDSI